MSGANSLQGGLTRRSFLKTTGVAAGAAALIGTGSITALADFSPGQVEAEGETLCHCVCRGNCFGFCNLNVHVRDGRVVKTSKWQLPETPEYTRICQRGLTHPERIYNHNRLKYPMRRIEGTERGAGQWERISWDEAIDEIATKIKDIQVEYGKQAVAFMGLSGNYGYLVSHMYTRLQSLLNATAVQPNNDIAQCVAADKLFGVSLLENNEATDMVNADTIILNGSNLTDSIVHTWHFLKEAQAEGVKIIVIDPTYNVLASKADEWVPIRPGSDLAMFLGIMNIIKEKDAIDEDFMIRRTVAPFLVREDDGMFLRRSDMGTAPTDTGEVDEVSGEPVMYDPYMVLEGGKLKSVDEAVEPELFATYTADGIACTTAFKFQMDEIAEWTPEAASEATDIPVEKLYELADYYTSGSVYSILGYGPINYINGAEMTAAAIMVHVLTGNLGKPGATIGPMYQVYSDLNYAYSYPVPNPSVPFPLIDWVNVAQGAELAGEVRAIKMAFFYCGNPVHTAPTTGDWKNIIIPSLDYIVVADSAMTDTASFADLVLPIAQQFEFIDFATDTYGGVEYNEKAIDPPFEAKSDADIVRLLAAKLELDEYFQETDEDICKLSLETPTNIEKGLTWEALKENKWMRAYGDEPYIAYPQAHAEEAFATPSGRIEFYCEHPAVVWGRVTTKVPTEADVKQARLAARWQEPSENWYKNDIMKKYPLSFLSQRNRFRVHSQFFSVDMLKEISPEPVLYVNPADAQERSIEDGGYVEAYNDRGHCVAKAVYSEAVRSGSVVYPKGWQIYEFKAGSWSELLNPDFSMWSTANNFGDAVCDIRPWIGEGEE